MKKNIIVYGSCEGVFKTAVKRLTEILLEYTCVYPACVRWGGQQAAENARYFYIGTRENNGALCAPDAPAPTRRESYRISVAGGNVYIEGADAAGVLYGVIDFYGKYLVCQESTHASAPYLKNPFEGELEEISFSGAPGISRRGLWTWGHVIYDFRGYIENMTRLKMNTLIVWNDFAPLNAREMIAFAHENNISVIWGFPWGWDTDCARIDIENLSDYTKGIVESYEESYAPLGGDGIYFQTATELGVDTLNGRVIAEAVTEFVNATARELYKSHPQLEIQFGLHATSVKTRLQYLKSVDPRIRIVWENCGDFPFDYLPENINRFEETCAFVKKILSLRGAGERTGAVLKGLTKLDWNAFEHQTGPYLLGESTKSVKENRILRKRPIWRLLQAHWLKNGGRALEMIRLIRAQTNGNTVVCALVEDGMFEENVYFPVALMGMMLWEPDREFEDILLEAALQKYTVFA